jgi:hypothetical protein
MWITAAAGPCQVPGPSRRDQYRAGWPPAGWPFERPPLPLETNMPRAVTTRNVRHRPAKPVASAIGEGAIAIQLLPEYLQAPDSGRHP